MRKIYLFYIVLLAVFVPASTFGQSSLPLREGQGGSLKSEGLDTAYVSKILQRAEKNIASAGLVKGTAEWTAVRNIVANRYFELNKIYEDRDVAIKAAKDSLTGKAKDKAVEAAQAIADSKIYRSHFALTTQLSPYLNADGIESVKDGIALGMLPWTYNGYIQEILTLTNEEKQQIHLWLEEARELAIDCESTKAKQAMFKKYKGRINNYLSKRGYDMDKERKAWFQRIEEAKKKK